MTDYHTADVSSDTLIAALEARREIAAKATPGVWEVEGEAIEWTPRQRSPFTDQGAGIAGVVGGGAQDEQGGAVGIYRNEDAAHIAANDPATVTLMLAVIEAAERRRQADETRFAAKEFVEWEARQARYDAADDAVNAALDALAAHLCGESEATGD